MRVGRSKGMAREMPTTAYTEVQIDEDAISLTLISESGSNGAVVEDTERYTFDELQDMSGDHFNLRLSDESQAALVEGQRDAMKGQILDAGPDLPEVGDCLTDQNPPPWSDGEYLEVVEVREDVRCDEYVIQGFHEGEVVDKRQQFNTDKTVADANPSYDSDEPVVFAQYDGCGDWYAFPASRLA